MHAADSGEQSAARGEIKLPGPHARLLLNLEQLSRASSRAQRAETFSSQRWFDVPRLILPAAVISCFFIAPGELRAEGCTQIKFSRGKSSAIIQGTAQSEAFACYTLKTSAGQVATIKLMGGRIDDTAFNIGGLVDNRASYTFKTKATTYRIDVYRTFPRGRPAPFSMSVSVR